MPIKSYMIYPAEGRRRELVSVLTDLPGCEVIPAENKDVIILVTDTPDAKADEALENRLRNLKDLQFLALVAGYEESQTES